MVILDTNIIIDHLRQMQSAESVFERLSKKIPKESLAIAMITIQELYEGRSAGRIKQGEFLIATIAPLRILAYTYEIAKLAGEIARDLKRPIALADAAISATTIMNSASLATLNKKDFVGIKGLQIMDIETLRN